MNTDSIEGNVYHTAVCDVLDFLHEVGVITAESVVGAEALSAFQYSVVEVDGNDGYGTGEFG